MAAISVCDHRLLENQRKVSGGICCCSMLEEKADQQKKIGKKERKERECTHLLMDSPFVLFVVYYTLLFTDK